MAHIRPLTIRFFWVMLWSVVGVVGFSLLWLAVTGRAPPAVLSILPAAIAGFDAGRGLKRRTGAMAGSRQGLALTLVFSVVFLVTMSVVALGAALSSGGLGGFQPGDLGRFAGPILLFFAMSFVMIRVMLWFGGRSMP